MEQREFRLKDIWTVFKRCWYLVILAAILLGVGAGAYTKYFVDEEYTSEVSYIVVLDSSEDTDEYTDMQRDLTLRTAMTPGVVDILMTRSTMKVFTDYVVNGGCDYNVGSTRMSIALRDKGNLESNFQYSLDVSVTTTDVDASKRVAEAITAKVDDVLAQKGGFFRQVHLVELESPSDAVLTAPHMTRNVILAAFLGAVAVYLIFLLVALTDATVTAAEDVARYVTKPLLSKVPNIHTSKLKKEEKYEKLNSKLLCHHSEVFAVEESYRMLRTNLMYAMHVSGTPVYGVVSAMASEGKSLNSANIATAFAQIGRKVVIVDCDLRRSTQAVLFGLEDGVHGVAEFLAGIDETPHVVDTGVDNLYLLPGGYLPPDPTGLLHSDRFDEMINTLRGQYDCVIVDLPPVKVVPDALIVAGKMTGIVVVIESGFSNGHAVRDTVNSLEGIGATVIGAVLNGTETKSRMRRRKFSKRGDGYGYKYGYSYGGKKNGYAYGYGYGKKADTAKGAKANKMDQKSDK